jgi:hypothetical protein
MRRITDKESTTVSPRFDHGTTSYQLSVISYQKDPNCLEVESPPLPISLQYLAELIADCGRIELRRICADKSQNRSGWFDDPAALWDQARQWAGEGNALFTSLNQPAADTPRRGSLKDQSVIQYRRLLFDFDPERDKGCNSTNQQLVNALTMRDDFVQRMHAMGWPEPILAMSGNGAHCQYRVDIEVTPEFVKRLRDFYRGLGSRLKGAGVKFDGTTFNPARLCRLYGALNRKCPSQGGMPQRVATVTLPPELRVVPERALELAMGAYTIRQAPVAARQPQTSRPAVIGRGKYATLDVIAWMQSRGLYIGHIEANKHAIVCPWEVEHTMSSGPGETIVFESVGDDWPGYFCHHSHCSNRRINDVMDLFGDADAYCREVFRVE